MRSLLTHLDSQHPLRSAVTKLLDRLISERDWAAQEVLHMLLDLPLQQGSREVIHVDCCRNKQQDSILS